MENGKWGGRVSGRGGKKSIYKRKAYIKNGVSKKQKKFYKNS